MIKEYVKKFDGFLNESKLNEGGIGLDSIANSIYKKLKNNRNWEEIAPKEIQGYTKDPEVIKEIMNLLHGEDYFDDGQYEFESKKVNTDVK